jgi:hypothetical protein
VTIQGETIEQQFGEREVCFRTLDLYTSAVLEACLDPPSAALPEWRQLMNQLSETSCKVRRGVDVELVAAVAVCCWLLQLCCMHSIVLHTLTPFTGFLTSH